MGAMNSWADSDPTLRRLLKSPRTIRLEHSTAIPEMVSRSSSSNLTMQGGGQYSSNNLNWSLECNFMKKVSHTANCGTARPEALRDSQMTVTIPPPLSKVLNWCHAWNLARYISKRGNHLSLWSQSSLANTCQLSPFICGQVADEDRVIADWSGIKHQQLKAWASEGLRTGAWETESPVAWNVASN